MQHYTEDTLVQQTTAEYLQEHLGWQSVYAYNQETFGTNGLLGRESDRDIVLTRYLKQKLTQLNPGLPQEAYHDAVRQIVETSAIQSPLATNRDKYALLKDGVLVTFRDAKGELKKERLRVFDFDQPEKNHFLAIRELWIRGDLYHKRADIVGFVNGIPLLFIECKNVNKDLRAAYERNISDYKDTIPHAFHHNAIILLANGHQAKIGSITSRYEHFHEWKRLAEEESGDVDMETLLKGVCDKRNFMDLFENFIVFDDSLGEPVKILARNHQFLGVNRAVAAVVRRHVMSVQTLTPALSQRERENTGCGEQAHYRGGYQFSGLVERAREMRKSQTQAEDLFWELVRDRGFLGLKFRRQHQFGDYILDFYCHEAALVVELDGAVHDTDDKQRKDAARDAYLKSQGLRVVHIRNRDLVEYPETALQQITNELPLRSGRGAGGEIKTNELPSRSGRGAGGEGKTPDDLRRLGVFWHTQGSGKSYAMVFFTRKLHRKVGGNFTFLICTDRDDLDTQIYKTFAGCGLADNDTEPCRASAGDHLRELLSQHKAYVFTLVQKFNRDVPKGQEYSLRDDIIVITDEAHRTQYGTLALNMRNALPNASFIGFTGTPLFKDDEITRRIFGEYVSTYDFQRAVEDKSTVPLYYDARGEKLGVATTDVNERIAQKLEELEIEDVDVQQRLESELKRDYHIITAGKRLDQVARDFVEHYSAAWETGKAMLICIDKITCVKMYDRIAKLWNKKIQLLESQLNSITDDQEMLYRRRQVAWMRETQIAVVISEEQGEVDKFRKCDLDIIPHRRLIKNGYELDDGKRIDLDSAFKKQEHPFRIAIVCAMWLTGFDVPCLSTLYLDKPLKAHTLMQAIARANRVNEGKNNGLIVDYCGILKNLRAALATFAGFSDTGHGAPGGEVDPARPEEELLDDLKEAIALVRSFLRERGASLDDVITLSGFPRNAAILVAKEAANQNDETRKRFEILCREVFRKFKACIIVKGVNAHRKEYDATNIIYKSLQEDRELADITDIIEELHAIVDDSIDTHPGRTSEHGPYDISKIDFERLRKEFERSPAKNTTVQCLKNAIESRLQRLLEQNPLRTDFQLHYEEIVAEYNREKDRVTIEKTFEALLKFVQELDEEEMRSVREGLNEETLALFDLLKKPDLTKADIDRVKAVAVQLLETLKAEKLKIDHWRDKESTRDAVRVTIQDFLWSDATGLPVGVYSEDEVKLKTDDVYRHIYQAYPVLPSPYYAPAA